ncbi:MAG: metallophosphoesterase, partial [Deltaproteobacteria bacterium]|nr:metallophosphoesterase [Deltaproteobacteria bacterium]
MKINRRKFLQYSLCFLPAGLAADGFFIERKWVGIKKLTVGKNPSHRIVHFTDLHHKGDKSYLSGVINKINVLSPDFACFTGDLVEDKFYLPEVLLILSRISCPLFGVPGNHEYWSSVSFDEIAKAFAATGGKWLMDQEVTTNAGRVSITGATGHNIYLKQNLKAEKRILLTHYPVFVEKIKSIKFDLILAGHSHGGQVRIPFLGALILPYNVGRY